MKQNQNQNKVACYCRVSTNKDEQRTSLETQEKLFREYTKMNHLTIHKIYIDEGISGKSLKKRDGFNQMIRDAQKGLFSMILVKDVSRFSRNTVDTLNSFRELKKYNVELRILSQGLESYDGEFILTIYSAMAQQESSNLSNRVKAAKKVSAKEGRVPNIVFGYDKIPEEKFTLKINEREAEIVKEIFRLYTEEQMSSSQIAKRLNTNLVPTKKGGNYKWSQTVVCDILKNEIYIGKVCNGKTEVVDFLNDVRNRYDESAWIRVDKPELRIVSDELFNKANEIRKSRSNSFSQFEDDGITKKRRVSVKYPLSNLLRCSNDNYSFRRRSRIYEPTGYEYTYWSCSKRDYGVAECDNKIKVDEKEMERAIVNFLISLFQNGQIIREKFKKKVRKELSMRYESVYNIESLTAEKKKLEAKRDKLMDLYVEDGIDKEAVMAKIIPIDKRLSEINQIIEVYYQQDHVTSDIEKRLVEITDRIDDHLGNLLDNAFLKSIFEKFVVYPDGKVVAYIKIDKDTGEVLEIPFAELVDKKEVSVPNYTADI